MENMEARGLRQGERVVVNYHGEKHEVTVIESSNADRWKNLVTVRFDYGGVWATHHENAERVKG